jgi:hypothetical protein
MVKITLQQGGMIMLDKLRFLITGTHAYGPVRAESDLDIVVMRQDVHEIMDFLIERGIDMYQTDAQEDYNDGGFYFDFAFIRVNIIIAHDETDFMVWAFKTERMKNTPAIENREARLEKFNTLFTGKEAAELRSKIQAYSIRR